jgi:hypothetical protein
MCVRHVGGMLRLRDFSSSVATASQLGATRLAMPTVTTAHQQPVTMGKYMQR